MLSLFIVQHSDIDIFKLDEDEWHQAIKHYPQLGRDDEMMSFFPYSANAWIQPKKRQLL